MKVYTKTKKNPEAFRHNQARIKRNYLQNMKEKNLIRRKVRTLPADLRNLIIKHLR